MKSSLLSRYLPFIFIGAFMISIYFYSYVPKYLEFADKEQRRNIVLAGGNEKELEEFDRIADQRKFSAESTALAAMLIAGLGTLSTIFLGWKTYGKNNQEAALRIEKLELEIEELKRKDTRKNRLTQNTLKRRALKSPKTEAKLLNKSATHY